MCLLEERWKLTPGRCGCRAEVCCSLIPPPRPTPHLFSSYSGNGEKQPRHCWRLLPGWPGHDLVAGKWGQRWLEMNGVRACVHVCVHACDLNYINQTCSDYREFHIRMLSELAVCNWMASWYGFQCRGLFLQISTSLSCLSFFIQD